MAFPIIHSRFLSLQKLRLARSLNVSCSCLNRNPTGVQCEAPRVRIALNATCRLYDANRILPNISLPDSTSQQILEIMSNKSVQDACTWINETLPFGLPSDVDCSDVSTLDGICNQWNEFSSILRIKSKVDRLNPSIDESEWFQGHPDLNRSDYYDSSC